MSSRPDNLASRFLARLGRDVESAPDSPAAPAGIDELEICLSKMLDEARRIRPTVNVEDDAFLALLARHVPEDGDVIDGLLTMRIADLYLACACLLQDDANNVAITC